jgi:hypothetical protein
MDAEQARKRINRILTELDDIPDVTAHWDSDEAIGVWHALDELALAARMKARAHGATLAKRLPTEYTHPTLGTVHTETETTVKWDGSSVLTALSGAYRAIDLETGEIGPLVQAVPTDILRKAIPACGPNQTSSKWNKGGLTAAGVQPAMYSHTDYGAKLLKRGPRYRPGG